ncbi:MAG: type II toxin-antitoxin system death-on-curing family toxin [Leptospiraceae bacterium]|nr:type II toxin-antitoxin system death-on-curing family toxin [Leptospiraceae bacterium]
MFNTIYEQAAAYLFYISKNHLFYDGNKRTALAVACTFLEWNDKKIVALNEDEVFDFVTKVAESENNPDIQIPIIASWLERMVL